MQRIFARHLCLIITASLFAMLFLGWEMQSLTARHHMIENSVLKLSQVSQMLENNEEEIQNLSESLKEDYLTRAHAFAYIIQQNPEVLTSREELEKIKQLLIVDELHVIDENGILTAGTVEKYFGLDFATTKQTSEFLQILEDPSKVLVQDIQPNGAEKKVFQYVGVAREDKKGIVQVGLAPVRILEARKKNDLPYLFSNLPVDQGSALFAIDPATGQILAHTDPNMNQRPVSELGFGEDYVARYSNGGMIKLKGQSHFYYLEDYGSLILGASQEEKVLYHDRVQQMTVMFLYFFAIYLIVLFAINNLLKTRIVDGIQQIVNDLSEITRGNLDTIVKVDSNPEFKQLSSGINQMVSSILEAAVKVPKVIDMVDLPIGVFEYNDSSDQVMATDRLRLVMGWSQEYAQQLYEDKEKFIEKITQIQTMAKEEEGLYRLAGDPEKWLSLRMTSDSRSTFGVAADVTKETIQKMEIIHERDYDSLTNLCNIGKFREEVSSILECREKVGIGAIVMLDLDCFKVINDEYGHDWGDSYLRITADFLNRFNNENGIASRRSGDEFCLFLYGYSSKEELLKTLDDFYEEISISAIAFPDGSKKKLRISSGLAWCGEKDAYDYDALMKNADMALYSSKRDRKGTLQQYCCMCEE